MNGRSSDGAGAASSSTVARGVMVGGDRRIWCARCQKENTIDVHTVIYVRGAAPAFFFRLPPFVVL